MPGFSYGGYGDGTNWSSERGSGPAPGGGSTGNAGNHEGSGSQSSGSEATAEQKQIDAIRNNAVIRQKLAGMIKAARKINPYAKLTIQSISQTGVMSISVTELNAEQASKIGLSGMIMGVDVAGTKLAIGNFATGIYRDKNKKLQHSASPAPVDIVTDGSVDLFTYDPKSGIYTSTKYFAKVGTLKSLKITGPVTYRVYLDFPADKAIDVTINKTDPNNINVTFNNWSGPQDTTRDGVKKLIKEFVDFKLKEEREFLIQASSVIVSAGQQISKSLGVKYNNIANEIAADIKNFQGKTFRNIDAAMVSLNKLLANPKMKIKAGDKPALLNTWNHLNATDMAYKFGFLGKAFSAADITIKIENLRQKTIKAVDTGDWKPVLLEVESWILSGIATGIALSILASLSTFLAATVGLPATIVTVLGIIGIALAASLIDDKLADKINNWLLNPLN